MPGSDPAKSSESVALMGHLDHLGVKPDARPGEDRVYNGALDNAAGVATMIETARKFAAAKDRPRRSVMFVANTGEERGLLGADYLAAHPPAGTIVGVVDLDMPLLLYDFTDVVAFGAEHSTIARTAAAAGAAMGIAISPDPMPEETLFVRSDHYRFVLRGVPAVFLMTGFANGGKQAYADFFAKGYHSLKDDMSQPIRWNAGARYAELNYRIARAMAYDQARPMGYSKDYFGDRYAAGQAKAKGDGGPK
jgi:Zn-dependent M28 family amino/carboxypeptidase